MTSVSLGNRSCVALLLYVLYICGEFCFIFQQTVSAMLYEIHFNVIAGEFTDIQYTAIENQILSFNAL